MHKINESFSPDLDAYFVRIRDRGTREPTLATLNRIIEAHVSTIPFENLDMFLGRPISLFPENIERKLVFDERGGYCFEQNTLMLYVLIALGFQVQPISARVRFQMSRSFVPARTHMFLRVELDGESWLVDVGVGGMSVTCALRLQLDVAQPTPHEPRRIVSAGQWNDLDQRAANAVLYHQVLIGGTWEDVCDFTLEEMFPIDRELGNWFVSTHTESPFFNTLMVARSSKNGRVTLLNRELKHRDMTGKVVSRTLENSEQLLSSLRDEFSLVFPSKTQFDCAGLE
ncbi:MAG: arylamine N-acetyltransferase [Verrucomicrobiales bacterium]|nr:arylamine N-acetyltransferase [Verrucomicrobiales bacterium]